jgi:predicted nucleic acid binding AN1-type Zn finger protein
MLKCYKCKRKKLILYECRCKGMFCIKHKYSEDHSCNFNYHDHEKARLENTKIKFNTKINLI